MRDAATVSAMLCPVCKVGLAMSDRQGVEIDYCPQCRGVWLDRGELDKILAKERAASAADPDDDFFREVEGRRRPRTPEPESREPKRRRRSFLEDLLDFD